MKVLDFYKAIAGAAGLTTDEDGRFAAVVGPDELMPLSIGNKRLVLPTREHFAADKDKIVLFHPLQENILANESAVMARFRKNVNLVLNIRLGNLMNALLVLAASPSMQENLRPESLQMLSLLKDVDEKSITNYAALLDAMPPSNTEQCLVHFYIKRNGQIHGKTHRRVAVVKFPLYEEIKKGNKKIYGVTLRNKDLPIYKHLMEHVLPNLEVDGAYNRGSISDASPSLEALLLALVGIASHINALVDELGDAVPEIKELAYDDSWVDALQNVDQFAAELRMMPMQAGNEGVHDLSTGAARPMPPLSTPNPHLAPPPGSVPPARLSLQSTSPPVYAGVPTAPAQGPVRTGHGLDFAASMRAMQMGQPGAGYGFGVPYGQPAPGSGPGGARAQNNLEVYRPPGYGQPAYGQPQAPGYGPYGPNNIRI